MDKKKEKVVFIEPTGAQANVFAKSMTIPLLGPVPEDARARLGGVCTRLTGGLLAGQQFYPHICRAHRQVRRPYVRRCGVVLHREGCPDAPRRLVHSRRGGRMHLCRQLFYVRLNT